MNFNYLQVPPPVLPTAIFDEGSSQSEIPDSANGGLGAASRGPEEATSSYPPVSSYEVPPSYPSAPAYQQPTENYQLPPTYDHATSYQQPDGNYQGSDAYEAPTSSYQAAPLSEPDEPLEHMTARQRFDRRNRQAMVSHQVPPSSVNHIENASVETRCQSPELSMQSAADCDVHAMDTSSSVIANAALASRNVYSHDDGPDAFDGYPASLSESSGINHEVSDAIESYSSSAVVVPRKKGSIFKSRAQGKDDNKKRLALYKHKWSDNQEGAPGTSQPGSTVEQTENHGKLYYSVNNPVL